MRRLLFDQGLPRSAAKFLNAAGWDVLHVGECGLSAATDAEILAFARQTERVVCTLDADFHALLARSGDDGPSVIRIRREGLRGAELSTLLMDIWARMEAALTRGAVISITERALRFRHLPIGRSNN